MAKSNLITAVVLTSFLTTPALAGWSVPKCTYDQFDDTTTCETHSGSVSYSWISIAGAGGRWLCANKHEDITKQATFRVDSGPVLKGKYDGHCTSAPAYHFQLRAGEKLYVVYHTWDGSKREIVNLTGFSKMADELDRLVGEVN